MTYSIQWQAPDNPHVTLWDWRDTEAQADARAMELVRTGVTRFVIFKDEELLG